MSDEKTVVKTIHAGLQPKPFTSEHQPKKNIGRPKGSLSLTTILRQSLRAGNKERAKELVEATIKNAMKGHPFAMKTVWDRIDGVIDQTIDLNAQVIIMKPGGIQKKKDSGTNQNG